MNQNRKRTDRRTFERDPDRPVGERDHARGPDDAPVTLVQYGDFECSHCGDVYPVIERLRERLGPEFRYVYRHFPLTDPHPHARRAAEAAETAGAQGAFWEMYHRLYEHQDELADDDLKRHADALDLDVDRFAAELDGREHADAVREDFDAGIASGVVGTPTFFVNGERYDGPHTFDGLLRAVSNAGDLSEGGGTALGGGGGDGGSTDGLRETLERSRRGAPSAGAAVSDRFSADEIFQRVVATADEEFGRSNRLLFLSGLTAGIVMGFSFLGTAALTALLGGGGGAASAVGYLLYPLGFITVVLGSYQLFTENTFTPVTLVLTRIASLPALLRVWGVVFTANIAGAAMVAYVLATTGVFSPETATVARGFGAHFIGLPWATLFWKGVFAGALVAGMVWLVHAARDVTARVLVIFVLTYTVAVGELAHSIVGSAEVLYYVFGGGATVAAFLRDFLVPATLGNTVGGVVLVALLNYSQTRDRRIRDRDCRVLELEWSEWLFGNHIGRPIVPTLAREGDEGAEAD